MNYFTKRITIGYIIIFSAIFLAISSHFAIDVIHTVIADPDKKESGKGDKKNDGRGRDKDSGGGKEGDGKKVEPKKVEPKKVEPKKVEPKDNDDDGEVQKGNVNFHYNFEDEGNNERKNFNFAAAGDWGCSSNTKKTVSSMLNKKPELVLALGDLSVDTTATCWLNLISPFDNKLKITLGYHDVKGGISKLNKYKEVFGLNNLYSSFDYRHVHFIIMSTLSDYNVSSDQYKFIEKDLKNASANENIDWIVVTNYGPFYTSPSAHPPKNDIRNIYHPLFDRYGVDLVIQGHNHNYQRTYPVTFNPSKGSNPIITNTLTTGYNGSTDGIVYAIVGTAGEGFHPLEGQQPYVARQIAGMLGFLNIEISNSNPHTNLTGTFYDDRGSSVQDYFTIEKEMRN